MGALARARRVAPLVALGGLLAGCEGSGLLGSRLSGNWCIPASASSGELLMLSLSGDGTGLLALIPGTRPSLPLDWREDRQRLLLLQPGSQEIAYTVPIVTDAQGQPQLMVPGLGSLLDLHLQRCGTTAGATLAIAISRPTWTTTATSNRQIVYCNCRFRINSTSNWRCTTPCKYWR